MNIPIDLLVILFLTNTDAVVYDQAQLLKNGGLKSLLCFGYCGCEEKWACAVL